MTQLLDELLGSYNALPAKAKEQVAADALAATRHMRFLPLPGPQTDAYLSKADVLLYGGQAGGGKSFLEVGLSQEHRRTIVFRREVGQTDGLEEAGKQIFGSNNFNGSDLEWTFDDGRSLKLAGMKDADDWNKYAGRERDLMCFDEAGEFLEQQVASLLAWNRGPEGQRCRMVLGSNPPRTADGAWMLTWFAPWLEDGPDHAAPGELRYAVMIAGKPVWQSGPESVLIGGDWYKPLSFTFIPASLADNPFRDTPEYRAKLNSLPEPLRSQLLKGIFQLGGEDDPWQLIPTAWVQAAIERWKPEPPKIPMCCIGVDVAQGGADQSVLAPRHDGWFAPLIAVPGSQTPGGTDVAGLVISKRRNGAQIVVDIGGGWGGDAYAHLKANIEPECVVGYMGVKESSLRTRDKQLRFTNVRTQAYWQFREALDPDQQGGSSIALPNDRELLADLCAPHFEVVSRGIKCESKEDVVKKLGRSPDKGDAVVMSWFSGAKAITHAKQWSVEQRCGKQMNVNLGRFNTRRQR